MNEPVYTYVKGQGWVIAPPFKVLTFDKGDGWTLVCENRVPEPDERYFCEYVFEDTANNLSGWSLRELQRTIAIVNGNRWNNNLVYMTHTESVCTIKLVKT